MAKEIGIAEARLSATCSGKCAITVDQTDIEGEVREMTGVLPQIHRFEPLTA